MCPAVTSLTQSPSERAYRYFLLTSASPPALLLKTFMLWPQLCSGSPPDSFMTILLRIELSAKTLWKAQLSFVESCCGVRFFVKLKLGASSLLLDDFSYPLLLPSVLWTETESSFFPSDLLCVWVLCAVSVSLLCTCVSMPTKAKRTVFTGLPKAGSGTQGCLWAFLPCELW